MSGGLIFRLGNMQERPNLLEVCPVVCQAGARGWGLLHTGKQPSLSHVTHQDEDHVEHAMPIGSVCSIYGAVSAAASATLIFSGNAGGRLRLHSKPVHSQGATATTLSPWPLQGNVALSVTMAGLLGQDSGLAVQGSECEIASQGRCRCYLSAWQACAAGAGQCPDTAAKPMCDNVFLTR